MKERRAGEWRRRRALVVQWMIITTMVASGITTKGVATEELEAMLNAMRATQSYALFANAIASSDLRYEALQGSNFTFFAPTNASLSFLDLTSPASFYTLALRSHVLPLRLSLSQLRSLPNSSYLPTLLLSCNHRLLLSPLSLDGVEVVSPGIFYSPHLAAHGLSSIFHFFPHLLGDGFATTTASLGLRCGERSSGFRPTADAPTPAAAAAAPMQSSPSPSPAARHGCTFNCMVQPPFRRRNRHR